MFGFAHRLLATHVHFDSKSYKYQFHPFLHAASRAKKKYTIVHKKILENLISTVCF